MSDLHALHDAYALIDESAGDPWDVIAKLIDFELFPDTLEDCWRNNHDPKVGGRLPWDAVLMFKVLLVARKWRLSDENMEFMSRTCLCIKRFHGLKLNEAGPDRTTIHHYRDRMSEDVMRELLELFNTQLAAAGYCARDGQMIDSSFMFVPIQRNTREENQTIKDGNVPDAWKEDEATANVHDSVLMEDLMDRSQTPLTVRRILKRPYARRTLNRESSSNAGNGNN